MFTNVHAQEVEDEEQRRRKEPQPQPSPSRQRRGSSRSPASRSPSGQEPACDQCQPCCPEGDQCCCRGSRRGSLAHKRRSLRRGSESLRLPEAAAAERRMARTPSPRAAEESGRRRSSSLKIEAEGKLSLAPAESTNRRRSSSLKGDAEAKRGSGAGGDEGAPRRKSSLYGGHLSPNDALSLSDGVDEAGRRSRRNSSRLSSDSSSFRTDAAGHLLCPEQQSPGARRDSRRSVRSEEDEVAAEPGRRNSRRGLSRTPSPRHGSGRRSGSPRSTPGLDPLASRVCFYVDDCVIDDAPPEALQPRGPRQSRRATSMRDPAGARRYATKLSRHASDVTPGQRARAGSVRRPQRGGSLLAPGATPGGGAGAAPQELPPKERRRRTIVMIVGATFMFLLACSVLVVVVTLTHHSFRQPPVDDAVRKENEEYLSAIGRDDSALSSAGHNVTSGPPPLLLDNP